MLRKIAQKILILLYDKPLPPPDEREKQLAKELKTLFSELPISDLKIEKKSEMEWFQYMRRLHELVSTGDPREFLRWDVIRGTMFVEHARYIPLELDYLKKRPDWDRRWQHAINESSSGHPLPYAFHRKSSGNLIHQAYHLAVFEEQTNKRLSDIDLVVEFGGGYGSMCRLFNNLGFEGKYIIFDLKPFSLLQQYYLNSLGIPILTLDNFKSSRTGVLLLSDIEDMKVVLHDSDNLQRKMFLATWSISETPLSVRESFLPLVSRFEAYLIAYQDKFGEVNNVDFFNTWKNGMADVAWKNYKISQIRGSNYLLGSKESE